ncbi:hypothetical protein BH23GEM9_BH23GEM9_30260 [soil metagenome]
MNAPAPACTTDVHGHCSLCGDEAVPGVVISLLVADGMASVRTASGMLTAALDLVGDVRIGDVLLVHQGFAITKVSHEG